MNVQLDSDLAKSMQAWRLLNEPTAPEPDGRACRVEGVIPTELSGTLYRNGPGWFERNNQRKGTILDGDGFVQSFRFANGSVTYRSQFIATEKYQTESAAGEWVYPSWSALAPGGPTRNDMFAARTQANITIYEHAGNILAFDEVGDPTSIDRETLATLGPHRVTQSDELLFTHAHAKVDGRSGAINFFANDLAAPDDLVVFSNDANGTRRSRSSLRKPRSSFMHDWFATQRYAIAAFQPVDLEIEPMLQGEKCFMDCLTWRPELGGVLTILDTLGEQQPIYIDVDSRYMWHSMNAYQSGNTLIADFVGYDNPNHFIGPDPMLTAVIAGRWGDAGAPGLARRYTIDLRAGTAIESVIREGNFEFGVVNPKRICHRHRYAYAASAPLGHVFHTAVTCLDMEEGTEDRFEFGVGYVVGEPVMIPKRDVTYDDTDLSDPGWVATLVLDGSTQRSFVAVFDAERIADGPIATVYHEAHSPISFHGWWSSRI